MALAASLPGCGIPAAENALQPAQFVSLQPDLLLWTVQHNPLNQFVDEFTGYRYFYRLYPDTSEGQELFAEHLTALDAGIAFNQVETVLLAELGYRSLLPGGAEANVATPSIAIPPGSRDEPLTLSLALDPGTGVALIAPDGILQPDDADSAEDSVSLLRSENSGESIGPLATAGLTPADPDIVVLQQEFPETAFTGTVNLRIILGIAAIGLSVDGLRVLYSTALSMIEPPPDGSTTRSADDVAQAFSELFLLEVSL